MTTTVRAAALAVVLTTIAACGSSTPPAASSPSSSSDAHLGAQAASFDLTVNSPQRFLLGLIGPQQESVVYGSIPIDFSYLGTKADPISPGRAGPKATAHFLPIAGVTVDPATPGPQFVEPAVARGVYETDPMSFDAAGFWEASTTFTLNGGVMQTTASFVVQDRHQVLFVGDPAPQTANPVAGDPATPASAIDSRALGGAAIPDPELHATTIAEALEAHRPLMVVVSTPTYCTSRFCGPITDAIDRLAKTDGSQMAFVHLEVWADFNANQLNQAARDWIVPRDGGDGGEPWVFVVNRAGTITQRFDDVVSEAELAAAVAGATK